ncbi:hypothetical protein O181_095501 [Austropuccinia psidii MF-1]|uniref:Reverse transcriptase Ty1/copia-type domain-containing protein n=1 Tax=Austropuccinia psidii MF-1 TaxID=1389203 RepID=A0A9Q3PDD3_9BASI|nr:hypothetical protein [Austropuccinia psidii MF-1]
MLTKLPEDSVIKTDPTYLKKQEMVYYFIYWQAVGLLNYLVACTRPDLAYSASCLAQFFSNPSDGHELSIRHVIQYLCGNSNWCLCLGCLSNNATIVAYCDSDWGLNYDSRSFSGSCVFSMVLLDGRQQRKKSWLFPQLKQNIDPSLVASRMSVGFLS